MKKVICPAPGCWERRIHFEQQDTPRGPQYIQVPEDWAPGKGIAFCSLTCAAMSGLRPINTRYKNGWEGFVDHWKAQFSPASHNGETALILTLPLKEVYWLELDQTIVVTRIAETAEFSEKKLREGMCWEALTQLRQTTNFHAAKALLVDVAKRIDTSMDNWPDYRTPIELLDEIKQRLSHVEWKFDDED